MKILNLVLISILLLMLTACAINDRELTTQENPIVMTTPKENIFGEEPSPNISPSPNLSSVEQEPTVEPDDWGHYLPPHIILPEDFEYGEYILLVRTELGNIYDADMPLFEYSFLGKGISSISDGHEYYDRLNNWFEKEYLLPEIFDFDNLKEVAQDRSEGFYEKALRHLINREVIALSTSGRRVLCRSFPDKSTIGINNWGPLIEVIEDGKNLFNCLIPSWPKEDDSTSFDKTLAHWMNYDYEPSSNISSFIDIAADCSPVSLDDKPLLINDAATGYITGSVFDGEWPLYQSPENKHIGTFVFHAYNGKVEILPQQLTNDNELLYAEATFEEQYTRYGVYQKIYLTDVMGSDRRLLVQNTMDAQLSPDGKYLAYCSSDPLCNFPDLIPTGIYILNLETQETVYFPNENMYSQIVCWTKKANIDQIIEG